MRLAGQAGQLIRGLFPALGLGEYGAVKIEDLVATECQRGGFLDTDPLRLGLGQGIGNVAGAGTFGHERGPDGLFVDRRCADAERNLSAAQQRGPDSRTGGEDEVGHGDKIRENLCVRVRMVSEELTGVRQGARNRPRCPAGFTQLSRCGSG